ncbi:MAG: hypothetical protein ACJAXZ_004383, partial [Akkermansiaceae bacterium]
MLVIQPVVGFRVHRTWLFFWDSPRVADLSFGQS